MANVRVKKDVVEQMTVKLKSPKIENIKPEFAEKLQKSALNSQNKQITSKLQSNKTLDKSLTYSGHKLQDRRHPPPR